MLVYDGPMHVGQLQFRPYIPDTMSPDGLHDPLYWMDFSGNAPPLPDRTLALFCYHVGQRDNTSSRDSRYFGRGIGVRLLEKTLEWASAAEFEAVVAKGCPDYRPIIEYMGGLPTAVYRDHGFTVAAAYQDPDLRAVVEDMIAGRFDDAVQKATAGIDLNRASGVSVCVRVLTP
jgi:hypothetical protein